MEIISKSYLSLLNKDNLSFFRARTAIEKIERKDMLHIPFDKRGLISTQRFSIAGVPCLYLATTSFTCWMELNMPDLDVFQVSSYKLPKSLTILNMCISQYFINGQAKLTNIEVGELEKIYSLIEFFPLVCATSFKILETGRVFKSEYIISQLIMQISNDLKIDGIAYFSKKIPDLYAFPQGVNLAILIPSESKKLSMIKNKYWNRSNEISLTEPFKCRDLFEEEQKNTNLSYANRIFNPTTFENMEITNEITNVPYFYKNVPYRDIIFYELDNFLVNKEHNPFNENL